MLRAIAAKRKTTSTTSKAALSKRPRTSDKGNDDASTDCAQVSDSTNDKPSATKIVIKGKVPVDPQCTMKAETAHVLQENDVVYNFMLNQTNVQHNNNKYYLGQVLEDDIGGACAVWFRWGRVGKTAQTSLQPYASKANAISVFEKKFRCKTGNCWKDRANFTKMSGLYDLIEQDFGEVEAEEKADDNEEKKVVSSHLPAEVLELILLISDVSVMEHQMREMNYDASRAPLGKLTPGQIKAGYEALKTVSDCIEELEKCTASSGTNAKAKRGAKRAACKGGSERELRDRLLQACNTFYTRIPHNFGMRVPPLISTPEALKTELDLLKALEDIEAAFSIIKQEGKTVDMHPADRNYSNLKCNIKPIPSGDRMEKVIKDYVDMTHAPTHDVYKLEVLQTFELEKSGEAEAFCDYGTRRLLWHGSRITNWMGILGRGLKIAPREAPCTGYMFGKGVYFADCASKSANYAYPTSNDCVGIMALCEVSLGEINSLVYADSNANQLPKGKHSVQGVGRNMPDPSTWITLDDGVVVPCGKIIESKVYTATLLYNEFIVYDVRQIRLRYLVKLRFEYIL
ncbi:Poly [ADP-ribose] polymerase 2 [Echinococcus granulosus]|nr:Poly [ADP-ribose] polymerase 2 [Echinococcus granulosus]KAH9281682.1 Poly [ADP-ribose] polymerase 2 [Echinococcus granulosus]